VKEKQVETNTSNDVHGCVSRLLSIYPHGLVQRSEYRYQDLPITAVVPEGWQGVGAMRIVAGVELLEE
jgi:hypothetical protein